MESMGAKGAQRSRGTKGARRKILSILHPNTNLNPNPDPNTNPKPSPSPNPDPALIKTEYWDRASGGGDQLRG